MYNVHPYYYNYLTRGPEGTYQEVLQAILKAVQGEATAIEFYARLANEAPNAKHKQAVLHALEDEKIHLQLFTQLYSTLTGQQPTYQIVPVQYASYKEGLERAYEDELEAYEEYRNAFLLTQNQTIRDVFLRAFTDEIEHAMRFGFLQSSLS
ncbi:ferritin-like domain-containing protein [Bacillus sp. DX1.1]|uniref:ferritin-like domain-containing protein n=1 Tax=unclassified Bacillus (in: firmicutes) TaxID=185979 RepID=UPI0025706C19|nr:MULTISPECIES: ferritin-like domain-containing protein [unclassified Bacillus (in: firmicutes)]MDM5155699.1 ferritin-like domain-containing protein [Bacillus sp. DX1.1]WJE80001.1 ferritin-like domain-containing protein [Bacillus sp. DX3.1]